MRLPPTPNELSAAAANTFDRLSRGGLADLREMPRAVIDEGPQRTVYRYHPTAKTREDLPPLLLIPPLAAPALCFDLRRTCSLIEHELSIGRRVYMVDYGSIAFSDRDLGLEHWFESVIPEAVRAVAADAVVAEVDTLGWCLGGIMTMLAVADHPDLPVRSIAMVASPFDFTQVPLIAPLRPLANLAGGAGPLSAIYKTLGGAPAPIVKRAYQLAGFDKYVTKPLTILQNLDDRDFLAQIEAVDRFMNNMLAYPGRTFGQLYHRFFRTNDLASGFLDVDGRRIDLSTVRQPVLSIAGTGDGIAPLASVHHISELLPKSASITLDKAPGGHLGVLSGRSARTTTWEKIDRFLEDPLANAPAKKPAKAKARKSAAKKRAA
ncbi:MAG: alpha/beta hydrolase [Solirubrobacterales bacterium]|nr:alpha/beta hydrolase [Solirubrobacterales bacterium]